jgi:hypothetical protein
MKRLLIVLWSVVCFVPRADAFTIVETDSLALGFNPRMQLLGQIERVPDAARDDQRLYVFLKQARIYFPARYEDATFLASLAFAGEDEVSSSISLNLMDMYFDIPIFDLFRVRVGQFKIPYGRERLTDADQMQFVERSIQDLGFRMGRDVGLALYSNWGIVTAAAGIFVGGGRDVPQRFIPEDLGVPLLVGRVGVNTGADDDILTTHQHKFSLSKPEAAFYVNGLYMKDSLVGHSTVLNVKSSDKSLLLNASWNPFLARSPKLKGDFYQVGADAVVRTPLGRGVLSAEAEANYGSYANNYGSVKLLGGRGQLGYYTKPIEAMVRYGFLAPSNKFAYLNSTTSVSTALTDDQWIHEVTPGVAVHLIPDKIKLTVDFPMLFNVPVFFEPNVGSYVSAQQPGQASVVSTGSVTRENVYQGRVALQFSI